MDNKERARLALLLLDQGDTTDPSLPWNTGNVTREPENDLRYPGMLLGAGMPAALIGGTMIKDALRHGMRPTSPGLAAAVIGSGASAGLGAGSLFSSPPSTKFDDRSYARPPMDTAGSEERIGSGLSGPLYSEMRAYEPTWRDRIGRAIGAGLEYVGMNPHDAGNSAGRMVGSRGLGKTNDITLFDYFGLGPSVDAVSDAQRGDYKSAALNAAMGLYGASGIARMPGTLGMLRNPRLLGHQLE